MKLHLDCLALGVLGTLFLSSVTALELREEEIDLQAQQVELQSQPPLLATRTSQDSYARHSKRHAFSAPSAPKLFRRAQRWTAGEEKRLLELRGEGKSWNELIEYFPGRTWRALQTKYSDLTGNPSALTRRVVPWTPEENKRVLELVEAGKSWNEIAEDLPGRTVRAIRQQYRHLTKGTLAPKKVHKQYTAEEDKVIIKALEEGKNWTEISQLMGRDSHSLTDRINYLKRLSRPVPAGKLTLYTTAELEKMRELREKGMTWGDIQKEYFPERREVSIRNRYSRYVKSEKERKKADEEDGG